VFVELIEALRCPRPHEESQLIASALRTESRHIVEGVLGCPVCGAEFAISNGVTRFDEPSMATPSEPASAESAMRLAAFLELTDAGGFALVCGRWTAHADHVRRLSDTPLVLVNPPIDLVVDSAAILVVRDAVPLGASTARAAALDAGTSGAFARSAVRAVRPGGRVLGPVSLEIPPNVTELVRDDRVWVGERTAAPDSAPPLIGITRASR
jgi:uncharacterized protein YbaR (Trm112 family)